MKATVRATILNDEFWADCKDLVQLLKPIAVGIDRMQSDTEPISIVFHTFDQWERLYKVDPEEKKEAGSELRNERRAFVLDSVTRRWDLIADFVHVASYSVDPRFRNAALPIRQLDDAEAYFKGEGCLISQR